MKNLTYDTLEENTSLRCKMSPFHQQPLPDPMGETAEMTIEDELNLIEKQNQCCLVVYNDDHNTFEHVTDTLIRVCKHDRTQAEQCTYLVHFKGKCCVRKGKYNTLKTMQEGITQVGIIAEVI